MKPDTITNDPAFPVMAMDILSNVLSRADNPGELGIYLTEEIRDLTGARCVLLIQCLGGTTVTKHRVVAINPLRRREWAESPAVNSMYEVVRRMPAAQFWRGDEAPEVSRLLRREGFELSMAFPLNAGAFRVGAMLLLGLPDEEHISSVLDLLNNLSAVVALVLRNSFLFERQEEIIQERTAELSASEEKYRGLIQKIQVAVIVHGADTRIQTSNLMAQQLLGLTEEQMMGKSGIDPDWRFFRDDGTAMPPEEYPVNQVLATRRPIRNTVAGVHRPGIEEDIWILVSADPVVDEQGEITQVIVTFVDITGRRKAEQALREKTEELDRYFSYALDLLCIADTNGHFHRLNPQWESTLGFSVSELEGQHYLDFVHPDDMAATLQTISQLSEQKEVLNFVNRYRCKNGSYRWIEWRSFPSGARIYAVARDITEHKRMEEELRLAHDELEKRVVERTEELQKTAEELRTSEERYALAVQGSNDGIWDLNVISGESYHSPRWKSILGYEENELADNFKEWEDRIHPDDYQRVMKTVKNYLEGRIPVLEFEHRLRHKDGSYRWVVSRAVCQRDSHGKPYRMAGSLSDVTERKKLVQQLLQSQKMESVGILAGGVAHDFNNLLTAISGYGQILQENIPEDDELLQESIGNVLKAADRAAELTRGLLAFSRKQLISPKPVLIDTLIRDTSKLIQRIIGEDIEFSTNFSGKNPLVNADRGQIEQVLMNLVSNARDAMPDGGHLSINTSQVVVEEGAEMQYDLSAPGKYALISVADTGTGIDKKTLESIFEPFYTTKEVGKGTGLGLAIVHGIIKQHKGSVLASSEPGKGTTFDIYLPLVKGHAV